MGVCKDNSSCKENSSTPEGNTNFTSVLTFDVEGVVKVGSIKATTIKIASAKANIVSDGLIAGDIEFTAAGSIKANAQIKGNVNFSGNNGILILANVVEGNVDNTINSYG